MNPWALIPIGVGATASTIGAVGLASALFGTSSLSRGERVTMGIVMGVLVGSGAVLSTIGAQAASQSRRTHA
jgi:hypothetical protein